MRRTFIFILPIAIILIGGFTVFGMSILKKQEQSQLEALVHEARAVTTSMAFSVREALEAHDRKSVERLAGQFQTQDNPRGCAIYDASGAIIAVTKRFNGWQDQVDLYKKEAIQGHIPSSGMERFDHAMVYVYASPVLKEDGSLSGVVEIIYDATPFYHSLTESWQEISLVMILVLLLIIIAAKLTFRQIFQVPVVRLTEWFQRFQKGEGGYRQPLKDKDELGHLANEVEQVALTLRVARQAVVAGAQVRHSREEAWTESKLRNLIQAKMGTSSFLVVSNREPFIHVMDEVTGQVRCVHPASGVVTAIDPILRSLGGTWIAHGSGNADRKFVNSWDKIGVPPESNKYILKRVWLNEEEEDGYYYGFSNEGLWPLCHITHTRPVFKETDWAAYQKANQKFADAVLAELPTGPGFVFIQDYHFTILPALIKSKRPDIVVALFWHIPWPPPEVFSVCPYQKEILNGMLACDLIGFHVQYHCNNFLETCNRVLECRVDAEKFSVVRGVQETLVRAFPISIAPLSNQDCISSDKLEGIRKEYGLSDKIVAVSVDRLDYTKGIGERILAVDRFLEKYPEYKTKFVLVLIAAPSRTRIKRYHDFANEIDELVKKINLKYADGAYQPIIYLDRLFSPEEIAPFYTLADICIVSSLHDGMNLVAKEYVAAKQDEKGVLILSCFTGASRELVDALIINPYSTEEFADAIHTAVIMPDEEKHRRMVAMRKVVQENNIYRWAGSIVNELTALRVKDNEKPSA